LVIDNYDSFVYNLVHIVREHGAEVEVVRNDHVDFDKVATYEKVILSPGPGVPNEAGRLKEFIHQFAPTVSMLGVCLGHQAIGEVFGASLNNLDQVYHGKASEIRQLQTDYLFDGLPKEITVGRYHSWVVNKEDLPDSLEVLAEDPQGEIQAMRHKSYDLRGVQFHPESILTPLGNKIILNFLNHKTPFSS